MKPVKKGSKKKMKTILHSPRLSTVLMIEETLKDAGEVISVAELKRRLPKKVMHQTVLLILDYLQESGKILIGTKGVVWTYATREEINALLARGTEV
jgi:hypothetical protein